MPSFKARPDRHDRKLAQSREALGYTRQQVARLLGTTDSALRQMEEGRGVRHKGAWELLLRYCRWLHDEAKHQSEARRQAWVNGFTPRAVCPSDFPPEVK